MYPRSNSMPSTNSVSKRRSLDSSTVMTPSLPTLSITSAISSPISRSAAEIDATCAMSSLPLTGVAIALISLTTASTALSRPRLRSMALAPAATLRMPSLTIACARTVAVVVPSPATSLVLLAASFRSWAPMFSNGSLSSMSLATVTPSWVTFGAPYFLSSATLRPFGPSVVLTASASVSTPRFRALRASSRNTSCLAGIQSFPPCLLDDRQDVGLLQDQELLAVDLDFGAGVLRVQHDVAFLDLGLHAVALVVQAARSDGQDGALLRLLLSGVRQHDAADRHLLPLVRADDQAVSQRLYLRRRAGLGLRCGWHSYSSARVAVRESRERLLEACMSRVCSFLGVGPGRARSSRPRSLLGPAVRVGLFVFALYLLSYGGGPHAVDEIGQLGVTASLVKRGALDANELFWTIPAAGNRSDAQVEVGPTGDVWSLRGPGVPLAMAPWYALAMAVPRLDLSFTSLLFNTAISAATAALLV